MAIKKTVIAQNENGVIFRLDKIPNTMFNFYVLQKKQYKDGTFLYHICVEVEKSRDYLILDRIRGTEADAVTRLEEIVENS